MLVAVGVLALLAIGWFVVNFGHPVGPPILLWLPSPAATAVAGAACWRTGRTAQPAAVAGRFWRWLAVSVWTVGVAAVSHLIDAVAGPAAPSQQLSARTLVLYSAGVLILLWALYRLPIGATSRSQRLTVWLDAGAVVLSAGVFLWHFATVPALQARVDSDFALVAGLAVMLVPLVAVFALAKVALSGRGAISIGPLRLLAAALMLGSLGSAPQGRLTNRPHLQVSEYVLPLVCVLVAWAAERQRAAARSGGSTENDPHRPRRPYSTVPYLAVVATDGLLLVAGRQDSAIAVGVVGLTALVVLRQITSFRENARLLTQLDHGASHDALTLLANRALFGRRLQRALTSADPDRRLGVALIDLDDFKLVNDALGHGVGDALLVAVAERLTHSVRPGDTVARLGGDEFAVVLDGAEPHDVDAVVERLMAALGPPVHAAGHELLIRASVGIADGRTGDQGSELLRRADVAMYAAKAQGGSRFAHYTSGMNVGVLEQPRVGAELRLGIDSGQLRLVYQPIVTLAGGRMVGVEALVRWAHPTRGTLGPADFIPVAERTGLIVPLGRWVLREACRQAAAWFAEHGRAAPAKLNVNVSAPQLREPGFTAEVATALAEAGLPPHRLTLEITETMAASLPGSVSQLHALRDLGVRIALDDFGTGQSTLSLLQSCPVDELKLDRSFTQADPVGQRASVAAAVLHVAQAFGLDVVAEGVETGQQASRLAALGYQVAQGYHFGHPVAAARIGELVRAAGRPALPAAS